MKSLILSTFAVAVSIFFSLSTCPAFADSDDDQLPEIQVNGHHTDDGGASDDSGSSSSGGSSSPSSDGGGASSSKAVALTRTTLENDINALTGHCGASVINGLNTALSRINSLNASSTAAQISGAMNAAAIAINNANLEFSLGNCG